jgi:hypothetical protein
MRHIQETRPEAMQVLVDSKPRFRAETERGPFRRGRRKAAYRYESWAKGPMVPNSVVVDLWDDQPFRHLFDRPGEVVILQSGEARDWKRILELLDGFVKANLKGRERRVIVDECLDFTSGIPGGLTRRMTFSIVLPGLAAKEISGLTWALTRYTECLRSYSRCFPGSLFFISAQIKTCDTYRTLAFPKRNRQMVISCSVSIVLNQAVRSLSRSLASLSYPTLTCLNSRPHREVKWQYQ